MLCVFWVFQFLVCSNDAKMFLCQYTNKNNQLSGFFMLKYMYVCMYVFIYTGIIL